MKTLILLFLVAVALVACKDDNNNTSRTIQEPDRTFAVTAAMANSAEIQISGVAADHSTNTAVKTFAQHMIDEHNTALNDLKSATDNSNVTITTDLDTVHQNMKQRLIGLNGLAFDTVFINGMVKDHRKVIADFEAESSMGQDTQLKGYADKYLPHLKDHLTAAQAIQASLADSTKKDSTKAGRIR